MTQKIFAKLYEDQQYGQILVVVDEHATEDEWEVKFSFVPEGFGVCSIGMRFKDKDGVESHELAQEAFEKIDAERAVQIAAGAIENITNTGLAS